MELDFTSDIIEKLMLKRALSDKSWLNILAASYDPRWFKTRTISTLIGMALKYYSKYGDVPKPTVMSLLAKKYAENHPDDKFDVSAANSIMSEVQGTNYGISDDVVSTNMREFIRKNALATALMDNIDMLSSSDRDSEKYQLVVDKCLENFDKVQKIAFADTEMGLNYFDKTAMDEHWKFLKNPDAKISTGWGSVDHYTNGGVLKEGRMLGLFMAQAGLGKSVFLSNLAVNFLKQNLSVVVISLEMSEDVYAQRFDAHISKKCINKLGENEKAARERINSFYAQYPNSNLVIKEYPPRSVNTKTIQNYLEQLKSNGTRIDVIIVDYLNLVLPNRVSDSMFKDGLSVSEELRSLSYKFKAPVISACQCNSEGMNSEEIDMQNISESRGIVHTVDFLGALFQTEKQRENGIIGFKIIKNRLGGMVGKRSSFKMDPETLELADVTFDNDIDHSGESNCVDVPDSILSLPDAVNDINGL